ncbi:lytic transglycosylase domain-containing protein [Aquabacterium humicola]|uniref:lytic transglycosylase domain-containing protein n=1 Tax=Aquabacterium humicola TaxID=3237377 RepID=UPI002542FF4C|nr:lytic transglycosylase domain-containing protein [Rubrivivax pictus]
MSFKACLAHLLLAAMAGGGLDVAAAQPCSGPLPSPAASMPGGSAPAEATAPTEGLQRFRLIASSCPTLPAPRGPARTAEQLQLFDRATVVALSWQDAPAQTTTLAMAALPVPRAPLNRDGERIVALAPALIDAARAHRLDPLLLHAIAHVESRHNPQAVSPAGARGLMQVMPATAERFGVKNGERTLQDPETNLRASAALLRSLQQRYGADLRLVLAAYNAGEGAVAKHGNDVPPYPETQAYVRDVSAVYRRLQSEFSVSRAGELVARGP